MAYGRSYGFGGYATARGAASGGAPPVELFPFPDLAGSTWAMSGPGLPKPTFASDTLTFNAADDTVIARMTNALADFMNAMTPGSGYIVAITVANYVAGNEVQAALRVGTPVSIPLSGNGQASATVVAGSNTDNTQTFRFLEEAAGDYDITDISVVAA